MTVWMTTTIAVFLTVNPTLAELSQLSPPQDCSTPERRISCAIRTKDVATVRRLLDDGADPSWQDGQSDSYLVQAVRMKAADIVELLLLRGADVHKGTPLVYATLGGLYDPKIVKSLSDAGATDVRPVDVQAAVAVHTRNAPALVSALKAGADPNFGDLLADSVTAAFGPPPSLEIVETLLTFGAEVNDAYDGPLRRILSSLMGDYRAVAPVMSTLAIMLVKHGLKPTDRRLMLAFDGVIQLVAERASTSTYRVGLDGKPSIASPKQDAADTVLKIAEGVNILQGAFPKH